MIRLTIDGKEVSVPEGTLILDAAKQVDIDIPIFCYHEALGPLGACRMCLVEVEQAHNLATACTTRVREGMVVFTNSKGARQAREGVLGFLLVNHPLDCPVCDKGGECVLQDNTFEHGPDVGFYEGPKMKRIKDYPINPFILLDQERCILCQRCTRFMTEYVGNEQLMMRGRGVETVVATVDDVPLDSPYAGNIIDLCPVGALLPASYRFKARPWNITIVDSICPHCPMGCTLSTTSRDAKTLGPGEVTGPTGSTSSINAHPGHILRVQGRVNERSHREWLCDRGRFSYDFAQTNERVIVPLHRGTEVAWEEALVEAVQTVQKAKRLAVYSLGSHTCEEEGAMAAFAKEVLHATTVRILPEASGSISQELQGNLTDVQEADLILLVGADVSDQLPVLQLLIEEAQRQGAKTVSFGLKTIEANRAFTYRLGGQTERVTNWLLENEGEVDSAKRLVIVWDGQEPTLETTFADLKKRRSERTVVLPTHTGRNLLGARRFGFAAWQPEVQAPDAVILFGDSLEAHGLATKILASWSSDAPMIQIGSFPDPKAELFLPTPTWGELSGSYVNFEGIRQYMMPAVIPPVGLPSTVRVLQRLALAMQASWQVPALVEEQQSVLSIAQDVIVPDGSDDALHLVPMRSVRQETTAESTYGRQKPRQASILVAQQTIEQKLGSPAEEEVILRQGQMEWVVRVIIDDGLQLGLLLGYGLPGAYAGAVELHPRAVSAC